MKKENGRKQGGGGGGGVAASASASASASPCAACKLLRRRCAPQDCVFAPYFPADEPRKFSNVHKVFGASNVNKMLQELPEQQRGDAVSSMVYEANARVRDPVYGCVGAISSLQQQIDVLQAQLALAQADLVHLTLQHSAAAAAAAATSRSTTQAAINNSPTNSGSPSSSSSKITASQAKPLFVEMNMDMDIMNMDMAVEQATASLGGESMWSCG